GRGVGPQGGGPKARRAPDRRAADRFHAAQARPGRRGGRQTRRPHRTTNRREVDRMSNETTVTVIGNLTADPELRYTPNGGAAMAKFTVASTPRVFDRTANEYKDGDPLFLTCTAWRDLAEHAAESLRKGHRVVVVG